MAFADWLTWFRKPAADAPAAPPDAPRVVPSPARPLAQSPHEWLTVTPADPEAKLSGCVTIDSAAAYPYWLDLLGVKEVDQYWLEVAYQCIKLDAQMAVVDTALDPRVAGKSIEIKFSRAEEFAQAKYPSGRGPSLATRGKEARNHYVRIRGRMPM